MRGEQTSGIKGPPGGQPAFKPVTKFVVGVTGHKAARLGASNFASVTAEVNDILDRITEAAGTHSGTIQFSIVSALADGADSIVAEVALSKNWTLLSVLPFFRDEYRADFSDDASNAKFDRLLTASSAVFELPGSTDGERHPAAYETAGRVILDQIDVLLAVWDGGPAMGRGGAAQIVAEAVSLDIPVIQIDPRGTIAPRLLWDGLTAHNMGQQSLETVPFAPLDALPRLMEALLAPPTLADDRAMFENFERGKLPRWSLAIAYPLLLACVGVRRPRRADFRPPNPEAAAINIKQSCLRILARVPDFGLRLEAAVIDRFARADILSTFNAQIFRSSYVTNFSLACGAVLLTLLSIALPVSAKPLLLLAELATIGTVLALTVSGNTRGWHRRWLDNRYLAESLRCLAVASQIGILKLRNATGNVRWAEDYLNATAREIGLPNAVADAHYLEDVRAGLLDLVDAQRAYQIVEAGRMHRLEHRLHLLGIALFGLTALVCIGSLAFEAMLRMSGLELSAEGMHVFVVCVTIATAGLPALGAAIYGIRMQGEFADAAERAHVLAHQLGLLRSVIETDDLSFDTLKRRIQYGTSLLTTDLSTWHQTYIARPLSLPG